MFFWHCHDLVGHYFSRPVTLKISISRQQAVVFPAVTICNQNAFRITDADKCGSFNWLNDLYSQHDTSTFNYTKWGVSNVSMLDVHLTHRHLKKDMIASCRWRRMPCSADDFELTVTDAGVCYTFNARISPESMANATGVKNGLQLVVNIEQYEYMKGPHNAVGLKLLLHRQGDVPLVQDFGDNIPAGMHTFVAVSFTDESNLPPPHGDCVRHQKLRYFDNYTQAACYRECITNAVVKTCGCKDYYMPPFNTDKPPVCNFTHYASCLQPTIEAFNKNISLACVCPKSCNIRHYKSSTSYATANRNSENQFDISEEFLNITGKHLNKSLDTRERLLPDRRQANIEEAERVLRGLPKETPQPLDFSSLAERYYEYVMKKGITCAVLAVKQQVFQGMQTILEVNFIREWNHMNMYNFLSDSHELYELVVDSVDVYGNEFWKVSLQMRLKEKLIASKRVSSNLQQVHTAFLNGVLLVNETYTPNGIYDALFISNEMLKQNAEINETYIRLTEHMKTYIGNISALYNIFINGGHGIGFKSKCLKYSKGFLHASEECDRDIRVYEFLALRRPIQRIKEEMNKFDDQVIQANTKIEDKFSFKRYSTFVHQNTYKRWLAFNMTNTVKTIESYLDNLKHKRHVSKLYIANFITSDRITQLIEDHQTSYQRSHELTNLIWFEISHFAKSNCKCSLYIGFNSLLKAFYGKLYDLYKVSNESQKRAMQEYFMFRNDSSMYARAIRGELNNRSECDDITIPPLELHSMNVSLRDLASFKTKLQKFFQLTRLGGTFFSRNFLELNIYMRDLHIQEYEQLKAYTFIDLLSDIGGSMGLLIGASVITLFEAVDAFTMTLASRRCKKISRQRRSASYSSISVNTTMS